MDIISTITEVRNLMADLQILNTLTFYIMALPVMEFQDTKSGIQNYKDFCMKINMPKGNY